MNFGNRENECVTTNDGRRFFISRSAAVIATVIATTYEENQNYVLVNRRSDACPDYKGMLNMPCGYLDWDECAGDAAIREVYEECGLDVRALADDHGIRVVDRGMLDDRPWKVNTRPKEDDNQNVMLYYGFRFLCDELPEHGGPNKEVSEVLWMPVSAAITTKMAFGHHNRLVDYIRTNRP